MSETRFGSVELTSTGANIVNPGSGGWTCTRYSTGVADINFEHRMREVPAVVVSSLDDSDNLVTVSDVTYTGFRVRVRDVLGSSAGQHQDRTFSFIAIGN